MVMVLDLEVRGEYWAYRDEFIKISLRLCLFAFCIILIVIMGETGEFIKEKSDVSQNGFSGNCGIIAGAESFRDLNDLLKIHITIRNISTKNIKELKIYVHVPETEKGTKDNFSETILCSDDIIIPGETKRITYSFADDKIGKAELYVYNVIFEDETAWGDEEANESKMLENGYKINIIGVIENNENGPKNGPLILYIAFDILQCFKFFHGFKKQHFFFINLLLQFS